MAETTATLTPAMRRRWKPQRSQRAMYERVNYVYRLLDAAGQAVYIGRSVDPLARLKMHHATGAEWAASVVGIEAWGPFHWDDVVRLERDAIMRERPPGNKEFVIRNTYRAPVLP